MIAAADDSTVRRLSLAAPSAVVAAALLVALAPAPAGAAPAPVPSASDVARLQTELDSATSRAEQLAADLEQAAARDSALRTELDRLAEQQDDARQVVEQRARAAYVATSDVGGPGPLARLVVQLAAPELRGVADAELGRRAAAGYVRAAGALSDAVAQRSSAADRLRAQTEAYRRDLAQQADAALAAQEQARQVLAAAEAAVAAAEEAARAAAEQAATSAAVAALQEQLAAARTRLDAASTTTTAALAPAVTPRGRAAAGREATVLVLVEGAGSGYPAGYRPTGQVLTGEASWYGPGFVGSPTASGAPYDPERLTCAHKTLPLGTVVRVTSNGRSVSCLVDDRGPYVGDRILDMSRAGSRALGYDGVAQVVVEVLAPTS